MSKSDLRKGIEQGFGFFGIGLILFTIIIGVYAFVEPTNGPTSNFVLNKANPLSQSIGSQSANNGMYDNRIPFDFNPPAAYTMVCFKEGSTSNDQMGAGASTNGGTNCNPGDVGYIIEANERAARHWEQAKETCLQNGMRLPEPFEYKLSCDYAGTFGLSAMTGNYEWASNFALPMYYTNAGVGAAVMGHFGCSDASWYWVGRDGGYQDSYAFRCAK